MGAGMGASSGGLAVQLCFEEAPEEILIRGDSAPASLGGGA